MPRSRTPIESNSPIVLSTIEFEAIERAIHNSSNLQLDLRNALNAIRDRADGNIVATIQDVATILKDMSGVQFSGQAEGNLVYVCIDGVKSSHPEDSTVFSIMVDPQGTMSMEIRGVELFDEDWFENFELMPTSSAEIQEQIEEAVKRIKAGRLTQEDIVLNRTIADAIELVRQQYVSGRFKVIGLDFIPALSIKLGIDFRAAEQLSKFAGQYKTE